MTLPSSETTVKPSQHYREKSIPGRALRSSPCRLVVFIHLSSLAPSPSRARSPSGSRLEEPPPAAARAVGRSLVDEARRDLRGRGESGEARSGPMGGAVSGSAAVGDAAGAVSYPVMLNVYDLTPINNYLHWCGLGIFHSAVEVHGSEYSFGAHDYPSSGVFEVEPKNCPGFIYRCTIFIGRTSLSPMEFREFIQRMASEYHGDTYHLISKNCNHFTDDLSTRLTGKPIPGWVNRLARLGTRFYLMGHVRPQEKT
ncbi:hypothetical protein C2845_PM10G14570 [Panicum miliaceum]|uniref:PPPDE domain-containing protein n=1 Tax=Panicum miliaceum TaxID=4540 RepID=A0A3L6PG35_PANMI|nr:hypothetical protein C2845_PM10G14570 [Panicum miliaceum]